MYNIPGKAPVPCFFTPPDIRVHRKSPRRSQYFTDQVCFQRCQGHVSFCASFCGLLQKHWYKRDFRLAVLKTLFTLESMHTVRPLNHHLGELQ